MKKIILDGSEFSTREELHALLKAELQLPSYYGNNLDALLDCLTGDVTLPISIEWKNYKNSEKLLGDYAQKTLKVFYIAANILEENFNIVIS